MKSSRSYARLSILAVALLLTAHSPGARCETRDLLRWYGFATVGGIRSDSDVPYRRGFVTREISFDVDTKLGLNASAELGNGWSAVAQLLGRGSSFVYHVEADWVYAAFRPTNSLTFSAGKQKLPLSLVSGYVDVSILHPWIRPPDEFYFLNPVTTFVGPNVRYDLPLSEWRLRTEIYAGAAEAIRQYADSTEKDMASDLIGGYVALERTEQVTLRVSYAHAMAEVDAAFPVDTTTGPVTTRNQLVFHVPPTPFRLVSLGARVDTKTFIAYAEYSNTKGDDPRLGTIHSGYVTLGYWIAGILLPHYTVSYLDSDQVPPRNPGKQRSNTLGLKASLNSNFALKAEWQHTQVLAGTGLFATDPGEPVNFVSASLDFLF